ncbi:FAD-dependent oxidoreductase [Calidifontibacillus erzurumensis]|uniref:FAD-dependent oxidoreductase n=1 Tax=Calidifontibacillus erzurumensis TaxID=2741433 RepID=A0A8J8GK97_9BACI|nr:FAD-dependent oxidoreductase [Calidifontibacillus erzurumensis]NSL53323.1 FAD-dependent oxidoreductase [Calidifontibacillus erzurumensis]
MKKISIIIAILSLLLLTSCTQAFINPDTESRDKIEAILLDDEKEVKMFDVIVVGGEPEGVAAALSAARNGANTLLIEERDGLGGLFTYAKMNVIDFPHGINNKILSSGIFKEWHNMVGNKESFEIEAAKNAFLNLVYKQDGLSLLLNAKIKEIVLKDQKKIASIKVLKNNKEFTFQAKRYIDATQDANIAFLSGVPHFIGAGDVGYNGRFMAATLMIHLNNVDWGKIRQTAKSEKFGPAEVTREAAWGFPKLREMYKPQDPNMRLRGLNLIRNKEGYFINALQIFGVDGLSEASIKEGIERGKKETRHIVNWLQKNFPGFEHAEIVSFPEELYIRETRHIYSLYQLPVSDLWENKYHWDTIAYGGYPSDIQATSVDDAGAVVVNPVQYGIPFRSLVPQKITNLLVVGRSGGYTSLAQGSVRVVPTGMATGEAAGAASAIAIKHDVDFHTMAGDQKIIEEMQRTLNAQGLDVKPFNIPFPYEDKPFYPVIRELLNHRAIFGGYTNDLFVQDIAKNKSFSNLLMHTYIAKRTTNPNYEKNILYLYNYYYSKETKNLTYEEAMNIVKELPFKDFDNSYLRELNKWKNEEAITREGMFYIVGKIFGWI